MKYINIRLFSNGGTEISSKPLIYSGENESTIVNLHFEENKYKEDNILDTIVTITNIPLDRKLKQEDYTFSYQVFNNRFFLKHEHLRAGDLYITVEVTRRAGFDQDTFRKKWVADKITVLPAGSSVPFVDWNREYTDLYEGDYQTIISTIRSSVNYIEEKIDEVPDFVVKQRLREVEEGLEELEERIDNSQGAGGAFIDLGEFLWKSHLKEHLDSITEEGLYRARVKEDSGADSYDNNFLIAMKNNGRTGYYQVITDFLSIEYRRGYPNRLSGEWVWNDWVYKSFQGWCSL